jgi:predicted ATPase
MPVIRTPDQRVRIFVSSTLQELADERAAAKGAIQHMRLTPVMFEMGARAHPPRDLYRAYLAQSDVFLGIYWQRYGWIAPSEAMSGLEDEYTLAKAMPKLVYIKRAETREPRLTELIDRIRDADNVSYRSFSNAKELEELIENDLALILTERFAASASAPADDGGGVESDAPPPWLAPLERGDLIGRERLVEEVAALLERPNVGLVTLTGPGGTGKTRLAVHIANTLGVLSPDGAFYIALAGVRNPRDVVPVIVSTLEIPSPRSGGDPEKRLLGFLRARRALLVLDNFEHVIEAGAVVPRMLAACPHLKVLVTSREALRVHGEHEVPVPPLPHDVGRDRTPAMTLFEERAREVRPDFCIDDQNRSAVAELCRRLDALPLAIELAAARVRVLSPQAMLPRLDKSLLLLSGGMRDVPERHQTLRATIDWSLNLLRPDEQVVFRRLGVFDGSFSEEAAEAVLADTGSGTLDALTSLIDKSLLVRTEMRGDSRFHMLATVRDVARERVAAAGEERAARLRLAQWLEGCLAREHQELLKAGRRQAADERIAAEMAVARTALRFVAGPDGDVELAWRLYIHLSFSLLSTAQTTDALGMREIVECLPPSQDPVRAAIADSMWGRVLAYTWDDAAEPRLARTTAVLEAAGERDFLPSIFTILGMIAGPKDSARAIALLNRAVQLASEAGHSYTEGWARSMVIYTHLMAGALDEAQRAADEAIRIARRQQNDEGASFALIGSAFVSLHRHDLQSARTHFAEAAALARSRGAAWPRCIALTGLCSVTVAAGDRAGARALLEESLHYSIGAGFVAVDPVCGTIALMLAQDGERERALRVFAAVRPGAEDETGVNAHITDPAGALRSATREARTLLGNPPPVDPETLDLASVVQAALGVARPGYRSESV